MHHYLRHLANFARIVEAGSLRAASELIGTAPSGLSDSVRILETKIGAPLLIRHRTGVSPTSEGERVYAAACEIVDRLDEVIGPTAQNSLSGPCRLSIPTEVANTSLSEGLALLAMQHPGLEVSIFAEDELVDHSRFGRDYFLRFAPGAPQYEGLRTLWTGQTEAILVTSPSGGEDLSSMTGIFPTGSKAPHVFNLKDPKADLPFEKTLFASQPGTRLAFAKQGLGVTACLEICARAAIEKGELVRVLPNRFALTISIDLLTPHKRKRALDGAMVSFVEACFASASNVTTA